MNNRYRIPTSLTRRTGIARFIRQHPVRTLLVDTAKMDSFRSPEDFQTLLKALEVDDQLSIVIVVQGLGVSMEIPKQVAAKQTGYNITQKGDRIAPVTFPYSIL